MAASSEKKMKTNVDDVQGNQGAISQYTSCESSVYVLTNFPLIIKSIFDSLPAQTLNACARVCKIWRDLAQKVLKSRYPVSWNYFKCEESELSLKELFCSLKDYIQNLKIQPSVVIVFYTTPILDTCIPVDFDKPPEVEGRRPRRSSRRSSKETLDVAEWLHKLLPSSCNITGLSTDGIVGTNCDITKTEECEYKWALSLICFAEMEKLTLSTAQLDVNQCIEIVDSWNTDKETFSSNLIPYEHPVKSVLFFADDVTCPQEFGFSLFQEYGQPLIAGGFANALVFPTLLHDSNHKHDLPSVCCVAFCGEVQIRSVIIPEDISDRKSVQEHIQKLKSPDICESRSLAFMFACIGRGYYHYSADNVESSIFRKLFPKTPLLGIFGQGEIGFNYPLPVPKQHSDENDSSETHDFVKHSKDYLTKHPPKLYHSYTTLFCLICLP